MTFMTESFGTNVVFNDIMSGFWRQFMKQFNFAILMKIELVLNAV